MKFAQFVELEKTLESNGYKIEDLKEELQKDKETANLFEFFGMNKALASWGVKSIFNKKLGNHKNNFVKTTTETIKQGIAKLVKTRQKLKNNIVLLNKAGKPVPDEIQKQLGLIERQIIKVVNQHIDKQGQLKTEQVEERIDSSKKMKDSAKLGLKFLWNKLLTEARIELLTFLMEQKIIESASVTKELMDSLQQQEKDEKEKAQKANDLIMKMKKCEEDGGTWDKEKKECIGKDSAEGEKAGGEL